MMTITLMVRSLVLFVALLWHAASGSAGGGDGLDKYLRYCYLSTMAQLRQGAGRFTLADLHDVSLCTHLVFVHAAVDPVNFGLAPAIQDDYDYYQKVTALKDSHPDLKVLLLVGGPDMETAVSATDVSLAFSQVVNNTEGVDLFVDNVIIYLRQFDFDGLELDWRYPGLYDSDTEDVYHFSLLVRKLGDRIREDTVSGTTGGGDEVRQSRLLLNVRVTGDRYLLENSVQLEEIIGYIDYLIVTAYDFYVSESNIGHNSGLLGRNGEPSTYAILNADYIVQYLTQFRNVLGSQIVLGIPSFGRTALFINDTLQAFGVPHAGYGPPGPYTAQQGLLAFYEICSLLRNGWTEVSDGEQLTPFAFSDEEIVTYDNTLSVSAKANYIKDEGLAGAALWDLSYDDFSGIFCEEGRFPLASALRATMTSPRSSCEAGHRGKLDVPGCDPCLLGTFQPAENAMTCLQCPQGLTTLTEASTEEYQCILPCPSGTQYNYVTLSCDPCPLGYYRQHDRDPSCLKCRQGHTTVATRSSSCVRRPAGVPESSPRQIDVRVNLTFVTASCENKPVVVGAVRMLVANYFQRLAQVWNGLCNSSACDNVITDVMEGCDDGDMMREKRQAQDRLLVTLLVANVSEEVSDSENTRETNRVITAALSERKEFQPLSTYGIRFAKLESLKIDLVCELGFEEMNGHCEQCEAGAYHNTTLGTCSPCPQGHYQDLQGQTACWPCPELKTTVTSHATSSDHCLSLCEAQPNYCFNGGVCHWSKIGMRTVYCECHHSFYGDRCEKHSDTKSAGAAGTVVGAVVGGILAFLIIVLVIVACCVCFSYTFWGSPRHAAPKGQQMRKMAQLNPSVQRNNSVHSDSNHYMSWGNSSKGSTAQRGVKFVDYIDYYTWLSNLSDYQQTAKTASYRKTKTAQQHASGPSTAMATSPAEPLPQQCTVDICTSNGHTSNLVDETNIDSKNSTDQK